MKRLLLALAMLLGLGASLGARAAVCSSTAGGLWTANIWGAACPAGGPTAADNVTINLAHAITFPAGAGNYFALSLTFSALGGAASLTHAANQTLTVGAGGVTINSSSNTNSTKAWNINTGSATVNGNVVFTQGSNNNNRIARINLTSGPAPAATLTINGNLTFNAFGNAVRAVINTTGGTADGQINLAGAFTVASNATLSMGAGNAIFNYNGTAAAQTVLIGTSAIVYRNLRLNNTNAGGATLGAAITAANVTGIVRVESGILDNGGFSMVGGAGDTFQADNGATFHMTGAAVFPTGFTIFTFGPTSTVRYLQTNNQTVSAQTYGHLEVSPAANTITHTFAAGTTTVQGDLTAGNGVNTGVVVTAATNNSTLDVNGSATISANTMLTAHASNAFTVAGSWTNNGAFTNSGGTVTFDGGAAQTIGGTASTTFNNLAIANTTGGVALAASETVSGTLTLTSGTFAVGANTLTLNGPAIAGTPANLSTTSSSNLSFGGSAGGVNLPSSVVNLNNLTLDNVNGLTLSGSPALAGTPGLTLTNGAVFTGSDVLTASASCPGSVTRTSGRVAGNLRMAFPAGAPDCTFHLGDATNYTPLRLNFSAVATPGSLTASVTSEDHRNTTAGTSGIDAAKGVNRYWSLKKSTVAGTYAPTWTYVVGDNDAATPANYRIRRGAGCSGSLESRTCTPWSSLTLSGTPTNVNAAATGVAIVADDPAEADFAIGEPDASTNFLREKQFIYTRELY